MGDLRLCSPEPNGTLPLLRSSSFPSSPVAIGAHYWPEAEEATREIISLVQPTLVSEDRRRLVIDYVQRLIRASLGCEVFPFGSVPLKTYLPDGDIDLTAFGGLNVEEALANDVYSILEREDQNKAAEFVVRDVQLIRAEVKLVKCLVQNIVVDISFNQLGGLSTLCFLEKVDCLIAKDHLFKRSIILIKAWCYYESRILGAHHGLISTYALETLVLYVFHLFHSSLNGPLAVLYKFLDYFSKFDWENYCISLKGPVRITSLPEIVAEIPDNGGGELLLSNDFLRDCVERFSSTSRGSEANSRMFPTKHLNIVDPLKENNNLGRSVSKGNFYRIRSAFTYGARKLGRILSQPEENLSDEICKFFSNTLDRHGSGQRPDVQDPIPVFGQNGFGPTMPFEDQIISESESSHIYESFHGDINVSGTNSTVSAPQDRSLKAVHPATSLAVDMSQISISETRISGDARDLATSNVKDLTVSNNASIPSSPNGNYTSSIAEAPHLYLSSSFVGNGEKREGSSDQEQAASSNIMKKKISSGITVSSDLSENRVVKVNNYESLSPVRLKHHPWYQEEVALTGSPKAVNSLSDLSGDFENHLGSLNCGRYWLDCALSCPVPPMMHSHFQRQNSFDTMPRPVQSKRNMFPQSNANGFVPGPVYYPVNNPPMMTRAPFVMEDMPKPRGTGTYFPNTNHYRDRPLAARGRNLAPLRSPRNNGRAGRHFETRSAEIGSSELPVAQFHSQQVGGGYYGSSDSLQAPYHAHQGGARYGSSDPYQGSPRNKAHPIANPSLLHQADKTVVPPLPEGSKQSDPDAQNGSFVPPTPETETPKPVFGPEENRVAVNAYKLKDDEDFPPLSMS